MPKLSAKQLFELALLEDDVEQHNREHLAHMVVDYCFWELSIHHDPAVVRQVRVHVLKAAALALYCVAEGITLRDFDDTGHDARELSHCRCVLSILEKRAEFLEEPDTYAYAVLAAAGAHLRPVRRLIVASDSRQVA